MISRLTFRHTFIISSLLNTVVRTSNPSLSRTSEQPALNYCTTMAESCTPDQLTVSYVTTPDEKTAKEIAHKLVEKKLAACVNILPQVTSIYTWEDKVNEEHEAMMIIKTTSEKTDALIKFVRENHPYSVAEVISMPIVNGNEPYLEWVRKSVMEKDKE